MAEYIEIVNDGGSVQVDDTFSNLSLTVKASVTIDTPYGDGNYYKDFVVTSSNFPVVGYVPMAGHRVGVRETVRGDGVSTLRFLANSQVTIEVYVFDRGAISGESFGCQIFNAEGECIFDLLLKYLRVVGIAGLSSAVPAGKKYAVVQSFPSYRIESMGGFADSPGGYGVGVVWSWSADSATADASNIYYDTVPFASGYFVDDSAANDSEMLALIDSYTYERGSVGLPAIIIDVTNY